MKIVVSLVLILLCQLNLVWAMKKRKPAEIQIQKFGDWPSYASDLASSKYSKLNKITPKNVKNLKVAWRWSSPDNEILKANPNLFTFFNESTPLAISGYLYVSTALGQVAKIEGSSGKTIWIYDPKSYGQNEFPPNNGFVHRGVTFWKNPQTGDERIIYGTGDAYLISLDARTGRPVKSFGIDGRIDLLKNLSADGKSDWPQEKRWQYGVTSPVTICRGVIIVGSSIMDGVKSKTGARGDVRGFNVKTGELIWTFHTIPTEGEPGVETWNENSNLYTGSANVWTMMSADENAIVPKNESQTGLVYLPTGTPTNDWYGGKRPGAGLYGESLVCLSCLTGQLQWAQQIVHHGLWDYDLPAAPNLVNIKKNGQSIKAVTLVTKQAFAFAFNRITGEPIWPIVETEVPQDDLQKTSPTQPFPLKPASAKKSKEALTSSDYVSFDRQGITDEDILHLNDEIPREQDPTFLQAKKILDQYNYGSLYTPPVREKKGTVILPGWLGGASWAGAANRPGSHILYVSSITSPWAAQLVEPDSKLVDPKDPNHPGFISPFQTRFVYGLDGKPYGSPLIKPPWGRLSAINLETGEVIWKETMGKGPQDSPSIADDLKKSKNWKDKDLGWPRRTHLMLTDKILFAGQSGDLQAVGASPRANAIKIVIKENIGEQVLKALDPSTGQLFAEIDLTSDENGNKISTASGNAYGAMMTFLDSKNTQYIIVPVGGANIPAELVALKVK